MKPLPPEPGAVKQGQLRIFLWLMALYPSWLSRRRPVHRAMSLRMFARITAREAREQ